MHQHLLTSGRVLILGFVVLTTSEASADEDDAPVHRVDVLQQNADPDGVATHPTPRIGDGSAWLSVSGKLADRWTGARDYGAMIQIGLPLERFASPSPRTWTDISDSTEEPLPAADHPDLTPDVASLTAYLPRLEASDARLAVRYALRREGLASINADVDDLATRARAATLLPELRLRVTRLVDEDQRLAPTSYDPARTTASGGVSLWMEARATWTFDRLVFADEELAIERLRGDRSKARQRVVQQVLSLLFQWQRAYAEARDPYANPEHQFVAALTQSQTAIELDILTDNWFSRWRKQQGFED